MNSAILIKLPNRLQCVSFSFCLIDVRLRKLAEEKDELLAQIRKLKNQLEEERQKHSKVDSVYVDGEKMENGTELHFIEMQSKLSDSDWAALIKPIFLHFKTLLMFRRRQQTD